MSLADDATRPRGRHAAGTDAPGPDAPGTNGSRADAPDVVLPETAVLNTIPEGAAVADPGDANADNAPSTDNVPGTDNAAAVDAGTPVIAAARAWL
ncbi:MAG TPA: hypothetical protein VFC59_05130, partial [Cryobacterium sp.]|nr:hypothetical protein [Cryobacterium sp.]